MSKNAGMTRRGFLKSSSATLAALGAASALRPTTARAAERVIGANDRLTVGLIGAGGMGQTDVRNLLDRKELNVRFAAACDVAEFRLKTAVDMANLRQGEPCKTIYGDYRAMLDDKSIDAVIIATPDLWHFPAFCDAVAAGKHVYQQKPMALTIEQGLEMVKVANDRPKQVVQIGTQRRSGRHYRKAKELIDQGKLGNITYARCWDTRNWIHRDPFAPHPYNGKIDWERFELPSKNKHAFDPHRYFAWRWFWDYAGGLITDVGVHVIDVVHWMTGVSIPKSAVANGGVYGLKYWQTPDVVNASWDYGTHAIEFTANFCNGNLGDGLAIYGSEATMEVRGHDIVITAESDKREVLAEFKADYESHEKNWVDCIRSGAKPNAPVELGLSSQLPLLLANLAYRSGKRLGWDPRNNTVVGL